MFFFGYFHYQHMATVYGADVLVIYEQELSWTATGYISHT